MLYQHSKTISKFENVLKVPYDFINYNFLHSL